MDSRTYLLIGNRAYAWERMVALGLPVHVLAVADSYLARALDARGVAYTCFAKKKELLTQLTEHPAKVVVSNGCPYILPISRLLAERPERQFVNLHPSYLPSMRGPSPIHGALLHGIDGGASCHVMDDGIDTGAIISRVRIPYSPDLDAGLLYQLAFRAEAEAFELAWRRDFRPLSAAELALDGPVPDSYFSATEADAQLDFQAEPETVLRRIRAFSTRGRPAWFTVGTNRYTVRDASWVDHPAVWRLAETMPSASLVIAYEDRLVVRVGERLLQLKGVEGPLGELCPGMGLA